MKKYVRGGIRPSDNGNYIFDYTYNYPSDLINIQPPQLYRSDHGTNVYWFGYLFNDDISSKDRTAFIHYIKGLSEPSISKQELTHLIELPLAELDNQINLNDISCFVYPISGRSTLVTDMIRVITRYLSHSTPKLSLELIKSAPRDIEFDWDAFEADNEPSSDDPHEWNRYNQMKAYVENVMMPKIRELDYFSLATSVKTKYRKYMMNFLGFNENDARKLAGLQGENILVVDDINTSGATLDEILRILRQMNHTCNIFVYTLIGK